MTRWSWIIIASAPEVHSALTTAWTSCWCTTMSSAVKPSGRESAVRFASSSVTSSAGPRTLVVAAVGASSSAARVRLERCWSAGAFVVLSVLTSFWSASRTPACAATRASPAMISWGRSRSPRRSRPWAVWKLRANITPAAAVTTGTSRRQVRRRRGRTGASAGSTAGASSPTPCYGGSTSFIRVTSLARTVRAATIVPRPGSSTDRQCGRARRGGGISGFSSAPDNHRACSGRDATRVIGYPCLNSEQGERSARVQRPRPQGDGVHPAPHEQGRRAQPHLVGARLHHAARPRAAVDRRLLRDRVQVPHRVHRGLEPRRGLRPAHGRVHHDDAVALSREAPTLHRPPDAGCPHLWTAGVVHVGPHLWMTAVHNLQRAGPRLST